VRGHLHDGRVRCCVAVQQHDGTLQTNDHVRIRMVGQTLWIHSGDRKGVLEVASGACSFVREMQRCLPYATSLHQHGNTHQITLQHGTVYLNLTGELHHLPRSSEGVPPNGVLVLLRTMHGTYVSVRGTLDEVKS
jgi:hypothetical protein